MNTARCKCGCYVPDRCHACGRELGELRNESAELAMLRAENAGLRKALAGLQAVVNGRRSGLVEWLREELAMCWGDWCMTTVVLVWLALAVHIAAVVLGWWAA